MKLTIYDVDHGSCARLVTPTGHNIFFDCGFNDEATPHPLDELRAENVTEVEHLVISNFDEDHVRGLPSLLRAVNLRAIYRNDTVSVAALRAIKEEAGVVSTAMEAALGLHGNYTGVYNPPEMGGVTLQTFRNTYADFQDTNNLSLVTLLKYGALGVLFPGDMEVAGWEKLLEQESFRQALSEVTVLVASHHGRDSGLCEAVFSYCKPEIIIISDKENMYETQEVNYRPYASGITAGGERRFVYTTRRDGTLVIAENTAGKFTITAER